MKKTSPMSSDNPKRALFEQFAAVAKTLGNGHRLELLELLAQGEHRVEGKRIFYRLADEAVVSLLGSLRHVAERNLAEVERIVASYFRERDSLEPISRQELIRRTRRGLVTVIDVRPAEEFAAGHIPGALNVPLKDLARRLKELPPTTEVVAYCRGPYCVLSYEAVWALRHRGFTARRLQDGYPEWRIAGLPVETTSPGS
jgi:ArsR family transcriptional regulator